MTELYFITAIANITHQYVLVRLFSIILKPRFHMCPTVLILFLGNVLDFYLKFKLVNAIVTYTLYVVFMTCILVGLFHGKWYKKIQAFFLVALASILAEIILVQVVVSMGYDISLVQGRVSVESVFINVLGVILQAFFAYLIVLVQNQLKYILYAKNLLPVFAIFLLQFIMSFIYCGLMLSYSISMDFLLWIYMFMITLMDLYIVQTMAELEIRQESQEKLESVKQREEDVRIYYDNLTSKLKNVSDIREGYENKLKRIYTELNLVYKPAESAMGEMDKEASKLLKINYVAENIINKKKAEIERLNCDCELNMTFADNINIEMRDLSSLLNNLLDNAIEAVTYDLGRGENKTAYIRGRVWTEDDMLVVELENSKCPEQEVQETEGKYISSKDEKDGHGYGLQIIRRIAEKYGGKMEIGSTENYFKNRVTIKVK